MKSGKPGKTTSPVAVQHISDHGFWLFVEATVREYFLPFSEFPWFKQATIADILAVEIERDHILHWSNARRGSRPLSTGQAEALPARCTDEEGGFVANCGEVARHEHFGLRYRAAAMASRMRSTATNGCCMTSDASRCKMR